MGNREMHKSNSPFPISNSLLMALLLTGTVLQSCLPIYVPERLLSQPATATSCPAPAKPLKVQEKRYASAAWQYFQTNYESNTGLVPDLKGSRTATMWGVGDYLAALHAARSLDIISATEFDLSTQLLLATLTKLPLFANELPSRSYRKKTGSMKAPVIAQRIRGMKCTVRKFIDRTNPPLDRRKY